MDSGSLFLFDQLPVQFCDLCPEVTNLISQCRIVDDKIRLSDDCQALRYDTFAAGCFTWTTGRELFIALCIVS